MATGRWLKRRWLGKWSSDNGAAAINAFLDSYVRWREQCAEVKAAYQCWTRSGSTERPVAFAAYREALDREEHAAQTHRTCVDALRAAQASVASA